MRNLISVYNTKNRSEGLNRWDNQREEASRQKRLAEVRAAVHSNRPPRPRAPGQVVSRATSAGSRIPQSRARSASSQRSYGTSATAGTAAGSVGKVDHIGPAKSAAKGAASRLDPRFLLSPAGRERDAQQYVSSSSEIAAMRAEMQDWYFARSSSSTAQEEFIEEQVEDLFEANGFEQVVKPSAVAEVRRRSPYSVDLNPRPRARSAGRPQSVPPCLAAGQPRPDGMGVQQPGARQSSGSHEGPETFIDRQPGAHAESPGGKASAEPPRVQPDCTSPAQAKFDKPSGSPDLRSAEAINDWLAQANQRLASVFSDKPTEDNQVTVAERKPAEGSRPDSLSNTGTTVYAPTVLLAASTGPCSPVAQSQGAARAFSAPNSPQQAELLDLSRTEEVAAAADPSGVASQNGLGSPGLDSGASLTHSEGSLELKGSSPAAARHATSGVLNSESEHFSDEDFDEDEEDVKFDASALDGDVVSDHGSSGGASLSFDAPVPVTSTARPGSAAGTRPESAGTRPESGTSMRPGSATAIRPGSATAIRPGSAARAPQLPPASASRNKGDGLGTTNASISYDEDFEAADVEEDETLGASFGGA